MPTRTADLFQLRAAGRPPLDDYLRYVAEAGLDRYRAIVQTGGKDGQSLATHVLDGVFVLDRLGALLGIDDLELRCLFAAYTVHDLNKVPPYDEGRPPYNSVVTPEHVAREAELLGLKAFFPRFDDYLHDVVTLARLHQGHQAVPADGLNLRRASQYRLGLDRVQQLGGLIRAADALDLSHGLDETTHQDRFLAELNAASPDHRFGIVTHRLAENRGLLTNLLHNVVVEAMIRDLGATPIATYPDGVVYLVDATEQRLASAPAFGELARQARERLSRLQREELGTFIRGAPAGIKVDPACFESGASIDDVVAILANRAQARRYSEEWRSQRETDLRADLKGDLPDEFRLPGEERLQRAELLSAYRILLDDHASAALRRLHSDSWGRVYGLIGLPDELRRRFDRANSFRRAYLLADHVDADFETLHEKVLVDARPLFSDDATASLVDVDYLVPYLEENLTISVAGVATRPIGEHLKQYVAAQHRQCSYCSAALATVELMKLNVPPSVGVQSYSNRLAGGSTREPKRNVCPVCRGQFVLERLAWVSHTDKYGGDLSTFYLHLFPYAFFTDGQLASWWNAISAFRSEDTSAIYLDPGSYFRDQRKTPPVPLSVYKTKRNGVAIPRFSEALGNTPTLAIHAPGGSFGEQSLLALETAAILARYFGCKALVSRTAVPILPSGSIAALFLDGAPRALRWLVPQDNLDATGLDRLMQRLSLLHQAQDVIRQGAGNANVVLELAGAAADDPLAVYFVADRLIARAGRGASDSDRTQSLAIQRAAPLLRALLLTEGRNPVEYLDQLARVAAQNHLTGSSFKRSSLLDPLDTALALTEQHPESGDREDLRGAMVTDIFTHLERIADDDYKPGRTKREAVKRYVDVYVDGLLAKDHHGDVNRLLNRARFIRSAYLFFLQEALDQQRADRTAAQSE